MAAVASSADSGAEGRLRRLLDGEEPDEGLSPAYRRILHFLRQELEEAVFLSGQEVARRVGIDASTLVRFSQSLGFSGYRALSEALRRHLMERMTPAARLMRLRSRTGPSSADGLLEAERASLLEMQHRLDPALLERVADRLLGARRVFVFGEGPAGALVELLAFRLRRFGLAVVPMTHTGKALFDHLAGLGAEDCLVVFGFGRPSEESLACLTHARDVGAPGILICDHELPHFASLAETRVQLVRRSLAEHRTMTAPVAFVEVLALEVTRRAPERTMRALETLERLRNRFSYPRLPVPPAASRSRASH